MSTRTIYPLYFHLPALFTSDRTQILGEAKILADEARKGGLEIGAIFDYFMREPYHGRPPHIGDDGRIVKNNKARTAGLGYYPFGWITGWNEAKAVIGEVVALLSPDYIQQGINAEVLNWKTTLPKEQLYRGYKDTMGMFREGIEPVGWNGTYVVSGWYGKTSPKARELFGSCITDTEFLNKCTFDIPGGDDDNEEPPPPPRDTLEERVIFLENTMRSVLKTFYRIEEAIKAWGS